MNDPAQSREEKITREGIGIRCATTADLGALIALEVATFSSDRLSPRQWRRHLASNSVCILVATDTSSMRAAALLLFRRNSSIARLYSLAVDSNARGLGLGSTLLAACEDAALQRGCTLLRLEVRKDNSAAQRLYESRGFRLFATRPGYYEDGEDALRFERALG